MKNVQACRVWIFHGYWIVLSHVSASLPSAADDFPLLTMKSGIFQGFLDNVLIKGVSLHPSAYTEGQIKKIGPVKVSIFISSFYCLI